MANNYQTAGMSVQKISTVPGTVVEVQSAVPAFVGFTEKIRHNGRGLLRVPEYIALFKDF